MGPISNNTKITLSTEQMPVTTPSSLIGRIMQVVARIFLFLKQLISPKSSAETIMADAVKNFLAQPKDFSDIVKLLSNPSDKLFVTVVSKLEKHLSLSTYEIKQMFHDYLKSVLIGKLNLLDSQLAVLEASGVLHFPTVMVNDHANKLLAMKERKEHLDNQVAGYQNELDQIGWVNGIHATTISQATLDKLTLKLKTPSGDVERIKQSILTTKTLPKIVRILELKAMIEKTRSEANIDPQMEENIRLPHKFKPFNLNALQSLLYTDKMIAASPNQEIADLLLLSRVLTLKDDHNPTEAEKARLELFFETVKGNLDLNKRLSKSIKAAIIPYGISRKSIEMTRTISFKTQDLSGNKALLNKVAQLVGKLNDKADKLSIDELGKLYSLAKIAKECDSPFKKLERLGILEPSDEILEQGNRAKEFLDILETKFQNSSHYKDGDIVAVVGKKYKTFQNRSFSIEEKLTTTFITPYLHGAKLFYRDDLLHTSEIGGEYQNEPAEMATAAYADIWRVDVTKQFSKEAQALLGDDWKNVPSRYEAIEREIHANKKGHFNKIKNSTKRRFEAGFADYSLLHGHKKSYAGNFRKMTDKLNDSTAKEMICSEFATKTTIAAMMQLNQELSAKVGNKLKLRAAEDLLPKLLHASEDVQDYLNGVRYEKLEQCRTHTAESALKKELSKLGYTQEERNLTIQLANDELFTLPYDKRQRLKTVHPGRMIALFKTCITRVPPHSFLSQIVK